MKCRCAALPAAICFGTTGLARQRWARSTARCAWQKRAKHARGKFGLKIEPFGAITLTGRNIPSFWGTKTG